MKKQLMFILIILTLILTGCGGKQIESQSNSDGIQTSLRNVEILLPAISFDNYYGVMSKEGILKLANEEGVISIKETSSGDIKIKMTKETQQRFLDEIAKELNIVLDSSIYPSIKKLDYSNDMSEINIYVDPEVYPVSGDMLSYIHLQMVANVYQYFYGSIGKTGVSQ
jgi:hypothetical protein